MKPEERFKILGARCLVQEIRQDAETTSGIVIPGREKEQTNKGVVLVIGDGAILEDGTKVPMKVSVGDHVLYSSFSGSPVKASSDDPDTFIILNERDILCVYNPD
jgi:chaperonin GroES